MNNDYNRYSYVVNNPMRFTDPSGYMTQKEFDNIIDRLLDSDFGGEWNERSGLHYYSEKEAADKVESLGGGTVVQGGYLRWAPYKNPHAWRKKLNGIFKQYTKYGLFDIDKDHYYVVKFNVDPFYLDNIHNDPTEDEVNYNDQFAAAIEKLEGKPYILGADGPDAYDCSSTACYGIRTVANSKFGDYTAHDLYTKFSIPSKSKGRGTVIFYDYTSDGRIDHITTILNSTNMLHPSSGAGLLQIKPINYLDKYTAKRGGKIYFCEFNWLIINKTP